MAEVAAASTRAAERDDEPAPADLRLMIEDDEAAGLHVYKVVNRRTGAVVQQLQDEQLLRLRDAQTYAAGQLIKTRA
jgi:flagellar protein FlaG